MGLCLLFHPHLKTFFIVFFRDRVRGLEGGRERERERERDINMRKEHQSLASYML